MKLGHHRSNFMFGLRKATVGFIFPESFLGFEARQDKKAQLTQTRSKQLCSIESSCWPKLLTPIEQHFSVFAENFCSNCFSISPKLLPGDSSASVNSLRCKKIVWRKKSYTKTWRRFPKFKSCHF